MKRKVLTSFTELTDSNLDIAAESAVEALTGNVNFTFAGTTLTDFKQAEDDYHEALGNTSIGGKAAVIAKREAQAKLLSLFKAVAISVNLQADGDEAKLKSSGIPLAAIKQHHHQPVPHNLTVANGANSAMMLKVKPSPVGDHGTVFAYTPKTNTETDPNKWMQKSVNGHKATILGLEPGSAYYFTAAYKGKDGDMLVWAPPISKIVSD